MSARNEWRRAVERVAADHGCSIEVTGGSHLRLRHPNGWCVITSQTPSENRRALLNLRAEVRRQARKTP